MQPTLHSVPVRAPAEALSDGLSSDGLDLEQQVCFGLSLTEQGSRLRADAVHVHDEVVRRLGLSSDQLLHLQSVLEQPPRRAAPARR